MTRLHHFLPVILVSVVVCSPCGSIADDPKPAASTQPAKERVPVADRVEEKADTKQAAHEEAFSKQMTNATLVGAFTIDGKNDGKPPQAERYELGAVKKLKDGKWLFTAKIQYGTKDFKIPIPITVEMKWAGDTPVITMTDLTIPAMGTFTSRVLFYGDRYVGTWQHGKVGGHMFGKIEPAKKTVEKSTEKGK